MNKISKTFSVIMGASALAILALVLYSNASAQSEPQNTSNNREVLRYALEKILRRSGVLLSYQEKQDLIERRKSRRRFGDSEKKKLEGDDRALDRFYNELLGDDFLGDYASNIRIIRDDNILRIGSYLWKGIKVDSTDYPAGGEGVFLSDEGYPAEIYTDTTRTKFKLRISSFNALSLLASGAVELNIPVVDLHSRIVAALKHDATSTSVLSVSAGRFKNRLADDLSRIRDQVVPSSSQFLPALSLWQGYSNGSINRDNGIARDLYGIILFEHEEISDERGRDFSANAKLAVSLGILDASLVFADSARRNVESTLGFDGYKFLMARKPNLVPIPGPENIQWVWQRLCGQDVRYDSPTTSGSAIVSDASESTVQLRFGPLPDLNSFKGVDVLSVAHDQRPLISTSRGGSVAPDPQDPHFAWVPIVLSIDGASFLSSEDHDPRNTPLVNVKLRWNLGARDKQDSVIFLEQEYPISVEVDRSPFVSSRTTTGPDSLNGWFSWVAETTPIAATRIVRETDQIELRWKLPNGSEIVTPAQKTSVQVEDHTSGDLNWATITLKARVDAVPNDALCEPKTMVRISTSRGKREQARIVRNLTLYSPSSSSQSPSANSTQPTQGNARPGTVGE